MFNPAAIDHLVAWMKERDRIRVQKASGAPRPWTSDVLLRDYRWCNVRRMDDAVSAAMIERWYSPDADPTTALAAACLGRLVNWPDSLMAVSDGARFRLDHLVTARARLDRRANAGEKVFTGAYVVPGRPGESKTATVVSKALVVAREGERLYAGTMRGTWSNLVALDGFGSFLAGQMVADIAHLDAGASWPDRDHWAPLGPGSARGLNRMLGRPKDKAISQAEFEELLPQLIDTIRPRVAQLWADRRLQAFDIQNCLCEVDKHLRLTHNEGTVRARYPGAAVAQEALL